VTKLVPSQYLPSALLIDTVTAVTPLRSVADPQAPGPALQPALHAAGLSSPRFDGNEIEIDGGAVTIDHEYAAGLLVWPEFDFSTASTRNVWRPAARPL